MCREELLVSNFALFKSSPKSKYIKNVQCTTMKALQIQTNKKQFVLYFKVLNLVLSNLIVPQCVGNKESKK